MPGAEDYQQEDNRIKNVPVTVTTYKIGERYFCHVQNKDPGATIARAEAATREEARHQAVDKATERLSP